ncbi:MAG: 5-formyltetrahydrofolate cyclo-ligase [Rhodospirillaceae bacterium]|nr:MAG: 5-formyltetrahydrofolate cyclo-ligase [Rhodospirillaceae bacterium]
MSVTDQKAALREGLIRARPAVGPSDQAYDFMAEAVRALMPEGGFRLAAYLPIRRELDPLPIAERLGHYPIALPRTPQTPGPLDFRLWSPGQPLDEGRFKTREPTVDAPILVDERILMLLPLVGFDSRCYRLGYGGGFYDRSLAQVRARGQQVIAVGLAYDEQHRSDPLPIEATDERLHGVITPTTVYGPGQND